jgi:hypothetical protein
MPTTVCPPACTCTCLTGNIVPVVRVRFDDAAEGTLEAFGVGEINRRGVLVGGGFCTHREVHLVPITRRIVFDLAGLLYTTAARNGRYANLEE